MRFPFIRVSLRIKNISDVVIMQSNASNVVIFKKLNEVSKQTKHFLSGRLEVSTLPHDWLYFTFFANRLFFANRIFQCKYMESVILQIQFEGNMSSKKPLF